MDDPDWADEARRAVFALQDAVEDVARRHVKSSAVGSCGEPIPAAGERQRRRSSTDVAAGARLLLGGTDRAEIRASVETDVAEFVATYGHRPGLAVVIVGQRRPLDRAISGRSCGAAREGRDRRAGSWRSRGAFRPPACAGRSSLNEDPLVSGIIVQMPLPPGLPLATVIEALDPAKDVDGIHPRNAGLMTLGYDGFLPTTAHAAVEC